MLEPKQPSKVSKHCEGIVLKARKRQREVWVTWARALPQLSQKKEKPIKMTYLYSWTVINRHCNGLILLAPGKSVVGKYSNIKTFYHLGRNVGTDYLKRKLFYVEKVIQVR